MRYCNYCVSAIDDGAAVCTSCGKGTDYELPAHHLVPGTLLSNKYYVGASLGEGGFGITYIGRDTKLEMKVAIKEYYPNGYASRANTAGMTVSCGTKEDRKEFFEKGKERFLREARILAKFSGEPGIVDVRDFFEENNTAYIVMEYLDGETLKSFIKREGTISPKKAVDLLMPVMLSLKKVHAQGLIHRDISPDNIMLVGSQVKLLDFGAARNVSGVSNKSLSVMLKPGYAPEEQYRSKGDQGPWTDIYALCATLYKCITGVTPDDSTQRVFSDEVKTPSALGLKIDPVTEAAIMKGLSVLKRDRYQSIDELLDGLNGKRPVDDSDEKTVYGGAPIADDDDGETVYFTDPPAAAVPTDGEMTSVASEYRPTADAPAPPQPDTDGPAPLKPAESNKEKPRKQPKPKKEKKAAPVQNAPTPATAPGQGAQAPAAEAAPPKKKSKKKLGVIILSGAAALVFIIGFIVIFKALNTITVCGEPVDKGETSLSIYNKEVTEKDMNSLRSLGKLERLNFTGCTFESGAFSRISDISTPITSLSLNENTGIGDYTPLTDLKYLTGISITNSSLIDDQLNSLELDKLDYLTEVDLSGNGSLSDLSPLSKISDTLTQLTVDNTQVSSFEALKDCSVLYKLSANGCRLTDLSSLSNASIAYLYVNNNTISDISGLKDKEYLSYFEASNNKIQSLDALADHMALSRLELNNNRIYNIRALSGASYLSWLEISDNSISSLKPLEDCTGLSYLYINRNSLISLEGLEKILELKVLEAAENKITDISGISNCTILESVNLNDNEISGISLLSKSAKTLEKVYFNNNRVSDISALSGADKLEYLSFDNNFVVDLSPLSACVSLVGLSAENNVITSLEGLGNCTKLRYLYVPKNQITDISAFEALTAKAENDFSVIDLSSNSISSLGLSGEKKYTYLSVYSNPLDSLSVFSGIKGTYLLFTYMDGQDYASFADSFLHFKVIDCPLDKQVEVKNTIEKSAVFQTAEEADKETSDAKNYLLNGDTSAEESDETNSGENTDGGEDSDDNTKLEYQNEPLDLPTYKYDSGN